MFWSTHKIIISSGHELHRPHYAHFYCYFSHRLGIERVNSIYVGLLVTESPCTFLDVRANRDCKPQIFLGNSPGYLNWYFI